MFVLFECAGNLIPLFYTVLYSDKKNITVLCIVCVNPLFILQWSSFMTDETVDVFRKWTVTFIV